MFDADPCATRDRVRLISTVLASGWKRCGSARVMRTVPADIHRYSSETLDGRCKPRCLGRWRELFGSIPMRQWVGFCAGPWTSPTRGKEAARDSHVYSALSGRLRWLEEGL